MLSDFYLLDVYTGLFTDLYTGEAVKRSVKRSGNEKSDYTFLLELFVLNGSRTFA